MEMPGKDNVDIAELLDNFADCIAVAASHFVHL